MSTPGALLRRIKSNPGIINHHMFIKALSNTNEEKQKDTLKQAEKRRQGSSSWLVLLFDLTSLTTFLQDSVSHSLRSLGDQRGKESFKENPGSPEHRGSNWRHRKCSDEGWNISFPVCLPVLCFSRGRPL